MSLKRMTLRDFVIVADLELELAGGFTALTGETGAGKSILIDALQLCLGARADSSVVRTGAERTELSAAFDAQAPVVAWLKDQGFDADDELLLRRVIDAQSKSRAWINGSPATVTQLRELAEHLVDIHGQHAWQSLTKTQGVRDLLDAYAQSHDLKAAVAQSHQGWRQASDALAHAQAAQADAARERERLTWQIQELAKLNPQADEWQDLSSEHQRLSNAQALMDAAHTAAQALAEAEPSASELIGKAQSALAELAHIEPQFQAAADGLNQALALVDDSAHTLRAYGRSASLDQRQLQALDERMSLWHSLARRYRRQPEDLHGMLLAWRQELAALDAQSDLESLQKQEQQTQSLCWAHAKKLHEIRAAAAKKLSKAVTAAIAQLGMGGGKFEVRVERTDTLAAHGCDDIDFLVAGHAGADLKPVGKVASGGELSRIALAVAVCTSELAQAPTLMFDEVDSGVGGAVAETVGRLMKQLGLKRQVLCVTHLPQVAACADHHGVVAKTQTKSSTTSSIRMVRGEERVSEIARMLGGEKLSSATLAHAKEMLGTS